MPRKILVIHNPAAGRNKKLLGETLAQLDKLGCQIHLMESAAAGDAERIASGIRSTDYDVIVAAGGDGTINEIVNGLGSGAPPFAVIPTGTTNVFALEIGMPNDPTRIARVIASGEPRNLFVGRANDRRFIQMAGVGFDGRIVAATSSALKRRFGKLAYVFQGLRHFFWGNLTKCNARIDGEERNAAILIVSNGRYYAGRFVLTPEASVWESGFQVFLCSSAGRWKIFLYMIAFALRLHTKLRYTEIMTAREIHIDTPSGEHVQLDGDAFACTPVNIGLDAVLLRAIDPASCYAISS